jgi:hypothetical protein
MESKIPINASRKIHHAACSEGKDAALSVKHIAEGYVFHCFRCGFEGFIGNNKLPASQIVHAVRQLSVPAHMEMEDLEFPADAQSMDSHPDDTDIPIEAYAWCWDGGITDFMIMKYGFAWSNSFYRVIIPIVDEEYNLQGYIGRDVFRTEKNYDTGKYILRKQAGLNKRIFFTCHAPKSTKVVVVEDPLSAIRVHLATGFETVALLNTHVGSEILREYMTYDMVIWLDDGQLANMVGVVARASEYGINATHISTLKDPKAYNDVAIRSYFKEDFNESGKD